MIKINLLPSEATKKRSQMDMIILGSSVGGLIVLLFIGSFVMRYLKQNRLEKELSIADNELRKYQNIVSQVEALQREKSLLEQRRNVIRTLLNGRLRYSKLFDNLIASIPTGIW
ncbi:MAG: hypothetical protein GF384_06100, partial [Elusimicrobia bacterium]|nr:hypothetical protein [Elusimicrobiota bacterium]